MESRVKKPSPNHPKPVKTIRRWCVATRTGGLAFSLLGDLICYRTEGAVDIVERIGERPVLMEMREVPRGRRVEKLR